MRYGLVCFALAIGAMFFFSLSGRFGLSHDAQERTSWQRAQDLWQLAIKAKGGSSRLMSVACLLVVLEAGPDDQRNPKRKLGQWLYLFPDKYWTWTFDSELRRREMNIAGELWNGNKGLNYWLLDRPVPRVIQSLIHGRADKVGLEEAEILMLCETRWIQPKPVRTRLAREGALSVDLVQTVVNDLMVDYYLDQETHLPLKVVIHGEQSDPIFKVQYDFRPSDYALTDGVFMPQVVQSQAKGTVAVTRHLKYQINPAYDPSFFEHPPKPDYGPDTWRRAGPAMQ